MRWGNSEARDPLAGTEHLGLPLTVADPVVEVVGVDPLLGVAGRVAAADQYVVADFGPVVDPGVVVGGGEALRLVVEPLRCGHVMHLVTQGPGLDLHRVVDPGHLVDHIRVGPGDVHHYRRGDRGAVIEGDARDPLRRAQDVDDLRFEPEARTGSLRCSLQVVDRQLGVVDIPGLRRVDRAAEMPFRFVPELVVRR